MYTVYILKTNKNTFYTGITNDLANRLKKHRNGTGSKYIRMFDSFKLVYSEDGLSKSEALKREIEIKRMKKSDKEILLTKTN